MGAVVCGGLGLGLCGWGSGLAGGLLPPLWSYAWGSYHLYFSSLSIPRGV